MSDRVDTIEWEIIGVIHSCYHEKFGIPRQPGLVDLARAQIELLPSFDRIEMFKELEKFSHIWVHFIFHDSLAEGWRTTVRPPSLGGQRRVGVFASRSPHRPNHLGLSAVRLEEIVCKENRVSLEISGGDFLNRTPVVDIKPYVPFSDCIADAAVGYSGQLISALPVCFQEDAELFCQEYEEKTEKNLSGLIEQVLAQDPRPASQRSRDKCFGMQLWDVNIRWVVENGQVHVVECRRI
jgi:tRNA (adenine37-N6)-methyltransferase